MSGGRVITLYNSNESGGCENPVGVDFAYEPIECNKPINFLLINSQKEGISVTIVKRLCKEHGEPYLNYLFKG